MKVKTELELLKMNSRSCIASVHFTEQEYQKLHDCNLARLLINTLETTIDDFDHTEFNRLDLYLNDTKIISLFHASNNLNDTFKSTYLKTKFYITLFSADIDQHKKLLSYFDQSAIIASKYYHVDSIYFEIILNKLTSDEINELKDIFQMQDIHFA